MNELKAVFKTTAKDDSSQMKAIENLIKECDKDDDGKINFKEFEAMMLADV